MNSSHDLITGLDDADLARLLQQPDNRNHLEQLLGPDEVMRILEQGEAIMSASRPAALTVGLAMPPDPTLPEIILLHGITDSHLADTANGKHERIWLNMMELMLGKFTRQLPLMADGVGDLPGRQFQTDGYASKKYDVARQAWRAAGFRNQVFCYDWRRSVTHAADALHTFLAGLESTKSGEKVVLVCHSMGGLVAATFANQHADWDKYVKHCVFVGSPLGGSHSVPMAILGLSPSFRQMSLLSVTESLADFQRMAASFPGLLDMIPNPDLLPDAADLYTQDGWPGKVKPLQKFLDASFKLKNELWTSPIFGVGTHLVSQGVDTVASMPWSADRTSRRSDVTSREGDGAVLNKCSLPPNLPAYRITGEHGTLLTGKLAFNAVMEIARGNVPNLPPITAADLAPVPQSVTAPAAPAGLVLPTRASAPPPVDPKFGQFGAALALNFASQDAAAAKQKTATEPDFDREALRSDKFSWQNALSLAIASEEAYRSDDPALKESALKTWGFNEYQEFAAQVAKGFICWDDEVVVLSFRGTEQKIADWLLDLNVIAFDTGDDSYGNVHRGFYNGYKSVESQVVGLLNRAGAGKKKLWLTGHSLGGALAVVTGAELQSLFPATGLITFGQPKLGMKPMADFYAKHFPNRYFRVRNDDDIVPQVPPGYQHFGKVHWFDKTGGLKSAAAAAGGLTLPLEVEESQKDLSAVEFESLKLEIASVQGPANPALLKIPLTDIDLQFKIPRFSVSDHSMSKQYLPLARKHASLELAAGQ